ncbi:MAG: CDP-alcohol phosphatidyltransferase family protein [Clostridia bacterium]|nr:CDP-alcohol phosphatidyltransferase family protein [Clostridia bacterium]
MNLPNKITVARICLIPLVVFFYLASFIPYGKLIATLIFIVACLTDFLDGKIARKYNMVTNLGKFLDPIADKVLVMSGLILIVATPITANGGNVLPQPAIFPYYVGIIALIIILARDFIINAFRQIAATRNIVIAADIYGKIKTTFQMIMLVFYFVYAFIIEEFYYAIEGVPNVVLSIIGYVLIVITLAMTIVSAWKYIANNRKVLKDAD